MRHAPYTLRYCLTVAAFLATTFVEEAAATALRRAGQVSQVIDPLPSLAMAEEDEEEGLEPATGAEDELPSKPGEIALARLQQVPGVGAVGSPPAPVPVPVPAPAPALPPVPAGVHPPWEVPAPAPLPALGTLAPAPAPAAVLEEVLEVKLSYTVKNVDYSRLSADLDLLDRFRSSTEMVIVDHSGGGVVASDVELELAAGSVMVQVAVVTPGGIEPAALRDSLDKAVDDGSLKAAMEKGLKAVVGIHTVTTGVLEVVDMSPALLGDEKEIVRVPGSAAVPLGKKPVIQTDAAGDETCWPACMAGRGICVDNVCFCRAPYIGAQCEAKTRSGAVRLTYVLVCATATVAFLLGGQLAIPIAKAWYSTQRAVGFQGDQGSGGHSGPKKETWKPRPEEKK